MSSSGFYTLFLFDYQWKRLDLSAGERKKLLCNLVFNLISMFCVFWSIYVLIERATLEAKYGLLDWPFWIKMMVSYCQNHITYDRDREKMMTPIENHC